MNEETPIRWWRVASHLVRPASILAIAGGIPSTAFAALIFLGSPGVAFGSLALSLLFIAGAVMSVGVLLLLFAGFSVVMGRLQWAIWTRRASGSKLGNDGFGPYR